VIMGPERRSGRRSLLGVVAYVRAAGHFRRAGLEVLRGTRELARPEKPPEEGPARRERIDIE
jgi:hypothetical protein